MSNPTILSISNFAQIRNITIELSDLTVLVGAQGTGKSIALQWLKAAIDGKQLIKALRDAGQQPKKPEDIVDLIFGVGMSTAWRADSEINLDGITITPSNLSRRGNGKEQVFFIPAHRSMLISDGWAAPFQRLTSDTPVVARIFSQNLYHQFSDPQVNSLFPVDRLLKKEYRSLIDDAIFHGGQVAFEQDQQHAKRLKLVHGEARLPFMTWTAGQREFTPLLLGIYHLLPRTKKLKQPDIDWVIIEEPEMGLHPQALNVVLLLVLELLWRGYRVVLSTHSPHVLTAIWMLQRLKEYKASWQKVCYAFNVTTSQAPLQKVAESALKKNYKVHYFKYDMDGKVTARDISNLDPDADREEESGWGGLTGFSSSFGDAVRNAVNENER